jgi:hypothetical protein
MYADTLATPRGFSLAVGESDTLGLVHHVIELRDADGREAAVYFDVYIGEWEPFTAFYAIFVVIIPSKARFPTYLYLGEGTHLEGMTSSEVLAAAMDEYVARSPGIFAARATS